MINLYDIEVGQKIILKNGNEGICTENMGDGQWIEIEIQGEPNLVHSQDIKDVVKEG